MNEVTKNSENYVGYEYLSITVKREMEGAVADGYPNFGWQLYGASASALGTGTINLKFKRDRKIRNKAELSRLQRQFEAGVEQIESLQHSKTTNAFIIAVTAGLVGTAFLGGATFAYIYGSMIPLMLVLAVPGFICWLASYPLYKRVSNRRTNTVAPLIDAQYDAIYQVCEKGHALLAV